MPTSTKIVWGKLVPRFSRLKCCRIFARPGIQRLVSWRAGETRYKKGTVLIGVLWSLFFLAALALVLNSLIAPQLSLAARLRDRMLLRYSAEAGIKQAIIELRGDETQGFDALNDGWSNNEKLFKKIALSDGVYFSLKHLIGDDERGEDEIYYGLIDEERKININTAPVEVLSPFFELVGETSSQEAADIADSIIDWRDKDDEPSTNGAESSYYKALNPGYLCKNLDFEILEELLLVKEMTQEIFDKVKGYLTVYGKGKTNINTADVLVLQSLGMRSSLAEKVIVFRKGDDGQEATEDDNVFNSLEDAPLALTSKVGLHAQEINEFNTIVAGDLVTVHSDLFRGYSVSSLQHKGVSMEIVFVVGRDEKFRYWHEY